MPITPSMPGSTSGNGGASWKPTPNARNTSSPSRGSAIASWPTSRTSLPPEAPQQLGRFYLCFMRLAAVFVTPLCDPASLGSGDTYHGHPYSFSVCRCPFCLEGHRTSGLPGHPPADCPGFTVGLG